MVAALTPTIQSIQFLVAVKEYKDFLRAQGELDATNPLVKLSDIVDKFVRDGSPFEVNIGSNTKSAVLKVADAANFAELSLVSCHTRLSVRCRLPKGRHARVTAVCAVNVFDSHCPPTLMTFHTNDVCM